MDYFLEVVLTEYELWIRSVTFAVMSYPLCLRCILISVSTLQRDFHSYILLKYAWHYFVYSISLQTKWPMVHSY